VGNIAKSDQRARWITGAILIPNVEPPRADPHSLVVWEGLRGNPDPYPDRWFVPPMESRPPALTPILGDGPAIGDLFHDLGFVVTGPESCVKVSVNPTQRLDCVGKSLEDGLSPLTPGSSALLAGTSSSNSSSRRNRR